MNRTEHLLAKVAEECAEIAQRATKALRFGLTEIQPGQSKTNAERLVDEVLDLFAVLDMLAEENLIVTPTLSLNEADERRARVEKYLAYLAKLGTLTEDLQTKLNGMTAAVIWAGNELGLDFDEVIDLTAKALARANATRSPSGDSK